LWVSEEKFNSFTESERIEYFYELQLATLSRLVDKQMHIFSQAKRLDENVVKISDQLGYNHDETLALNFNNSLFKYMEATMAW
jgi:hypothetical protein